MPDHRPETLRILAIETATEACSIALFEDGALIAHDHREIGRGHAETLVPMIAALPDKARAARILVSLGPGSFTGVRIGIATARALGVAWRADVLGYPTLALVAKMAQAECDAPVTVCMNGGHGEWFVEDFASGATSLGPLTSVPFARAGEHHVQPRIAGSRAIELARLHTATNPLALPHLPDARFAAGLPAALLTPSITPIYGRAPDARAQASALPDPAPSVA
jgi:tRNA threonylcarbamoyl adenosine modification protein YeaZ